MPIEIVVFNPYIEVNKNPDKVYSYKPPLYFYNPPVPPKNYNPVNVVVRVPYCDLQIYPYNYYVSVIVFNFPIVVRIDEYI